MKILQKKTNIVFLVLLLAVIIMILLEVTNTTDIFHKAAVVRAPTVAITHLSTPKQTVVTDKTPTSNNGVAKGGAIDENGHAPTSGVSTDPSQWATSASRLITVKTPLSNTKIQSGSIVSGSTSIADQVQYRLIDNKVGVISEGTVKVVNGNFAASINFTTTGSNGRLDVFNTDTVGKELNEVQLQVNF